MSLPRRVRGEVAAELARVRATARLVERDRVGAAGYLLLALAVGLNAWGLVRYGDRYMLMWIVASLYFYMFYWLLPLAYGVALALLRRREDRARERAVPTPEPRVLLRSVREARLLRFRKRFVAVGWNVWFLGGVSMTAGYLLIFSIDIAYALLAGLVLERLAPLTVALVLVQSVGIILYYLAVYFLRPYSSEFAAWFVSLLRGRRARGRSALAPTALLAGLSLALAVLFVVAILFPGHTLDRVLPVSELRAVAFHLYLLALLASQLVIMLVLHSWLSRAIARPVLASSERALAREARALSLLQRRRSPRRLRRIDRAISLLAETRLYRVESIRLFDLFTLFLLGSDFLAVLSLRDVRRMDPRLRLPGRHEK